ncbi:sugar ABC transporter substrate-binding protein [Micromonospora sp. KC207]|uniref:sugar ABC transporter substrate-binding protein n=1 Tax=Micromonospora sp. KC207 TaxID=2530377 RepID=UPI001046305F|nr:sugar ABC transporter substrate-binding protein [Micromonospora sp. KC207]TDC59446.1 sugar ABC transporter substrate-binding protein [Micromonospora sp. KC207]
MAGTGGATRPYGPTDQTNDFPEGACVNQSFDRRRFLALVGLGAAAVTGSGGLAGCTSKGTSGDGGTNAGELSRVLPRYIPNTSVKADIQSITGKNGASSDPIFLKYPDSPVTTVSGVPGKGGSYTTMTPLWGSIPPSSGNPYYEAVNRALGATFTMQPADGNTYGDKLPPLFAADKLPDWIQMAPWMTTKLNFAKAVGEKFVDLSPYLAGNAIEAYPNLANIPSSAWAAGVWNGKLYGFPVSSTGFNSAGTYFYRKDIFDQLGIAADGIKGPDDLTALGKQLTDAKGGRWAFDDMFGGGGAYAAQIFKFPLSWDLDSAGKLIHKYETEGMLAALDWHQKLVKAGYVHPDAVAGNTETDQRFRSGKVVCHAGGVGAWNSDDAVSGTSANPRYNRQAFKALSIDGQPEVEIGSGAGWFSYLNKRLSDDQIKECLAVANYLAAPYGSKEWLAVNFGTEGDLYEMKDGNPALTEKGSKYVATSYQWLASPPSVVVPKAGFVQVAKDFGAWQAQAVQYAVKRVFFGMNVTDPAQYATIDQPVVDTITDVRFGRKTLQDYKNAVETWRKAGGNAMRDFRKSVMDRYGTGLNS